MSSFKRSVFFCVVVVSMCLVSVGTLSAQLKLPRPSQSAMVKQTIGVTDISVTYSRPAVKGRPIFADAPASMAIRAKGDGTLDDQNQRQKGEPIVPYDHVWRTGANEATQFVVTDDVLINGQPLAAGSYSLHTIPGKTEWTIVFNGNANQWGSFNYDPAKDTLRVKAKPQSLTDHQEYLDFDIEPTSDSAARVNIKWEKTSVPFTVQVKDVVAATLARARTTVSAAKADDWGVPFNAANYAKANKAADEAAKWFEQSLKAAEEQVKAKPTYQTLQRKSSSLLALGRKDEAIAVAEKALEAGKAEKLDTSALEKRIAELKAAKP
jgi:hypothetical protein